MDNVLLDPLPREWNGYEINTWFQIGIQVFIARYDRELSFMEKSDVILSLLFEDEDGNMREHPSGMELEECVLWFLDGWNHDRPSKNKDNVRLVDFDVDQWRIFADFMHVYGVNLNESDMHWWQFCGMLWNMPFKHSSFLNVIDIRRKKITSKMGREEREAILEAQGIYGLDQAVQKEYTPEEAEKIDRFDKIREQQREARKKRREQEELFRNLVR